MGSTFLLSGKTAQGREAVEQVDAASAIEARKILEARGWTELRELSADIDDDSPASPAENPQFQQRTVPGFWRGWLGVFRKSPAFFIMAMIFLIVGIHQKRTQLERTPGPDIWICWISFMLAVGVFWYPVLYWVRRMKRRIVEREEENRTKAEE